MCMYSTRVYVQEVYVKCVRVLYVHKRYDILLGCTYAIYTCMYRTHKICTYYSVYKHTYAMTCVFNVGIT